ncbi:MAG: hypothetical protein QM689_12685 [Oscillospiraceae bacterium]
MPKKTKDRILRDEIETDLRRQLKSNRTAGKYYADLISDYMKLWETKQMLIADIKERGVVISNISASAVTTMKKSNLFGLIEHNQDLIERLRYENNEDKFKAIAAMANANSKAIALLHDAAITVRKNDSVADLLKTNAQMLKILNELGIKPSQAGDADDDEM